MFHCCSQPLFFTPDLLFFLPIELAPQTSVLCLNPWALLIFCRIYLVIRFIQTRVYSPGTRILGNWANFEFSSSFTIRDVLGSAPVTCLIVSGTVVCGP